MLITDQNWQDVVRQQEDAGFLPGAFPRESQIGELACAAVFSEAVPIIPQSEWAPRIKHATDNGLFIGQRWVSDANADYQNGTPLCHLYSLAQAIMAVRGAQGQSRIQLAAESGLGATGYRMQGGYLDKDLAWVSEHGMAAREFVPKYSNNPREWKAGWEQDALKHITLEAYDLGAHDVRAETISALLMGFGCYVGLSAFRHAVFYDMLAVSASGEIAFHAANTHGPGNDWWLTGKKAVPDLASFVIRSVTLSE